MIVDKFGWEVRRGDLVRINMPRNSITETQGLYGYDGTVGTVTEPGDLSSPVLCHDGRVVHIYTKFLEVIT